MVLGDHRNKREFHHALTELRHATDGLTQQNLSVTKGWILDFYLPLETYKFTKSNIPLQISYSSLRFLIEYFHFVLIHVAESRLRV